MSTSFPTNATGTPPFTKNEPLLNVITFKKRYLFGVDLTDEMSEAMPDSTMQHFINASLSIVEHELDLIITPRTFTEKYDYRTVDYTMHNFIQLKKRPAIEVTEIKAKFPNERDLVKYPEEWYVLEKETAQIQLSPIEGSFNGLVITNGGSYIPLFHGTRDYWPHLFEIQYKAGFCEDQIPVMINELIGLQAAISVFEILGDIVLGPGVAGESVNLDGAGVSKNLTSSAMYSAFSARVESYTKKYNRIAKIAKKYYNAIPMTIV